MSEFDLVSEEVELAKRFCGGNMDCSEVAEELQRSLSKKGIPLRNLQPITFVVHNNKQCVPFFIPEGTGTNPEGYYYHTVLLYSRVDSEFVLDPNTQDGVFLYSAYVGKLTQLNRNLSGFNLVVYGGYTGLNFWVANIRNPMREIYLCSGRLK